MARQISHRQKEKKLRDRIHRVWLMHQTPAYRRGDMILRSIGAGAVLAGLIGAYFANQAQRPYLLVGCFVAGTAVLMAMLVIASRRYRHAYREFVLGNLAEDQTFLVCLGCGYDLKGATNMPPRKCPECGQKTEKVTP